MATLETLNFDNSYTRLPEHFYQRVRPTPLKNPFLIAFNSDVAELLDLDPCAISPSDLADYLAGQKSFPGSEPIAMKYTGHQFGVYNPDLGDGRGLLLGEIKSKNNQRWDLHLKGAGKTAYSRFADGRAVLRSSIREYLISEAMHGLGIPTTRAMALVGSEELAMRNGMMEPCAAVLRVTQCHIRFGHFEFFYYTKQHKDLKRLADYCLVRYFPKLLNTDKPYLAMYKEVIKRSAELVAKWQAYGFIHAVLNTDNMSLIGETFDYGPYSFMDNYKPEMISNQNDHQGRYAFSKQPEIVHWNLSALGQALLPLIDKEELVSALDAFSDQFQSAEIGELRKRLGLQAELSEDSALIEQLMILFSRQAVDMNRFFRLLSNYDGSERARGVLATLVSNPSELYEWLNNYDVRLKREAASQPIRTAQMNSVNPEYILRNYMAEEAIREAEKGDFLLINDLVSLLRKPNVSDEKYRHYAESPPAWAGSICLTCSS
ncbi:MAG: protein adenylyltransferase SelO [Neptuniibacter sp.]